MPLRIQRPIGVYIMTAYDFLVVGVIPLLTLVFALRNSDAEYPFIVVLLAVGLYFGVMGAAVWAWVGDNIGRWLLLVTVSVVALQWIVNAIVWLSSDGEAKPSVIGFISRGITALALNWWYFNRKSTAAYYRQTALDNMLN